MSHDRHDNNFNLLRMVAASAVLVSHSFAIVGVEEPLRERFILTLGTIAVDVFFVTSGLLVCESLMRRGSLRAFAAARVLRIYPALIVAVLLTTLVCSLAFTTLPFGEFWRHRGTWSYVVRNIVLVHPTGLAFNLPETLMNVPGAAPPVHGGAINGSLVSLVEEIKMYIALALTFLAVRFVHGRWFAGRKRAAVFTRALTGAALVALAWDIALVLRGHWQTDGVHLFAMFFTGAALRGRDLRALIRPLPALAVLAAVLLASLAGRQAFLAVYILALPYLVLAAALLPGGVLRQYNRLGDYSYGTYIYAFPLQQWTAALWPGVSAWQVVAVALPSSVLMGVVSWHVIEKHMLALKSRVRPRPESAPPLAQHA